MIDFNFRCWSMLFLSYCQRYFFCNWWMGLQCPIFKSYISVIECSVGSFIVILSDLCLVEVGVSCAVTQWGQLIHEWSVNKYNWVVVGNETASYLLQCLRHFKVENSIVQINHLILQYLSLLMSCTDISAPPTLWGGSVNPNKWTRSKDIITATNIIFYPMGIHLGRSHWGIIFTKGQYIPLLLQWGPYQAGIECGMTRDSFYKI